MLAGGCGLAFLRNSFFRVSLSEAQWDNCYTLCLCKNLRFRNEALEQQQQQQQQQQNNTKKTFHGKFSCI